jgi:hypothetical protein
LLEHDEVLAELTIGFNGSCVLKTFADFVQKPIDKVVVKKTYFFLHYLRHNKSAFNTVSQSIVLDVALQQKQRIGFLVIGHTLINDLQENAVDNVFLSEIGLLFFEILKVLVAGTSRGETFVGMGLDNLEETFVLSRGGVVFDQKDEIS